MKLSTKGRYGLRALLDVACFGEDAPVSINSISERQNISVSYLEQLMAMLRKAGLIVSERGAQGGYRLSRPAGEMTVGEVLRALEGDLRAVRCDALVGEGCWNEERCVTKYVWKRINDSIEAAVDNMNIGELVEESRKAMKKEEKETETDYEQINIS